MTQKKTKIVCTLGPSSDSISEIEDLVSAGMNVARLNFSHGTYKQHKSIIQNIRKVEKKFGKRIGILQDLQGPKIRIGELEKDIEVKKGDQIILTTSVKTSQKNSETLIPIQYKKFHQDVQKNETILLDDGLIELKASKVKNKNIYCTVKNKGVIKSNKGVCLPNGTINAETITSKDKKDLKFGLKMKVDFIALSFVKNKKDIQDLRKLIGKKDIKIIAKIERKEAVENLEEIIKEADGSMVARGDLGVNLPPEKVPLIQKRIISLSNYYGKPVITATQVLHSMIQNPLATRAEISDAANAIFDHTDAIMLSNETSVGKYPAKAVRTLRDVAKTVESDLQTHEDLLHFHHLPLVPNPTCLNACELAVDLNVDKIFIYTQDGYTARQIAKHRIYKPLITITPDETVARQLSLTWGINKVIKAKLEVKSTEKMIKFLKKQKLIKKNEHILLLCNASKEEKLISTYRV